MITIRLLLQPGRLAQPIDDRGRPLAAALPGPVIGSAEPIRILFLDGELHAVDPPGFTDAAALRLSIAQDWTPATTPLYVTNALERSGVGVYDLADPSGTYTAEAVAALGALAAIPCAWEIAAYGGDPATEAVWTAPLSIVQAQLPLRNRSDSLPDPTILPPADLRGPPGPAATVAVGDTETLPPGSPATVENVGDEHNAVLNFGIPQEKSIGLFSVDDMTVASIEPFTNGITLKHVLQAYFRINYVNHFFDWTPIPVSELHTTFPWPSEVSVAYLEKGKTVDDFNGGGCLAFAWYTDASGDSYWYIRKPTIGFGPNRLYLYDTTAQFPEKTPGWDPQVFVFLNRSDFIPIPPSA